MLLSNLPRLRFIPRTLNLFLNDIAALTCWIVEYVSRLYYIQLSEFSCCNYGMAS